MLSEGCPLTQVCPCSVGWQLTRPRHQQLSLYGAGSQGGCKSQAQHGWGSALGSRSLGSAADGSKGGQSSFTWPSSLNQNCWRPPSPSPGHRARACLWKSVPLPKHISWNCWVPEPAPGTTPGCGFTYTWTQPQYCTALQTTCKPPPHPWNRAVETKKHLSDPLG